MNPFFIEALNMREHPIKKAKKKTQEKYITVLTYIVEIALSKSNFHQNNARIYITKRLYLYQNQLFSDISMTNNSKKYRTSCLSAFARPWRSKYRFMLICDIALILLEKPLVLYAMAIIEENLSIKRKVEVDQIISLLQNKQEIEKKYLPASALINQYRANRDFFLKEERKIVVTANMSAGKSTLINALIGKPVARTSQEVCTGNMCYLFNKAYEDNAICLLTQDLKLNATETDLHSYNWSEQVSISSYFHKIMPDSPRLCIIDTPGVDAALHKEHSKRAYDALLNNNYDIVLYVVSPTRLGTDAEKKHLRWVAQNLQKEKIIFVLNKLDNYHDFSDSIEDSILTFKKDLIKIGFDSPVICPISAYFSYLLKLKMTGQVFSEDEADEYIVYSKKFKRSSYDLSHYYEGVQCLPTDSEEIELSKHAGLYGLEKIIYGGKSWRN